MKKSIRRFAYLGLTAFAAASLAAPVTYNVDPEHTYPSFEADHFGGMSVWRGKFNQTSGVIVLDREAKTGSVNVSIDASSFDSGIDKLNKHVTSNDPQMLDAVKYPTATYQGKLAKFKKGVPTEVQGELTLHGVTKPVTLTIRSFKCMTHPMKKLEFCGADAVATINREDFGVSWGKAFGFTMNVKLAIQVEAFRGGLIHTEGVRVREVVCALGLLAFAMAVPAADQGRPLFDGKTLKGWKTLGGGADYRVVDGTIVGSSRPGVPNSFLVTEKDYGDFILEFDVRQDVGPTNSGIQFRSLSTPGFENGRVHGYQADIDPSPRMWSGGIYEEAQRGWFYTGEMNPPAKALYKFGEWNHYRVEAIGPRLRVWINGSAVSDVIDDVTLRGFFGLQVHSIETPEEAGRTTTWKNLRVLTQHLKPAPSMGIFIRNNLPNNLDPDEAQQGWRLLWDGKSAQGWRGADSAGFPDHGWSLANGELAVQPKGGGGDIMTEEEFGAFELQMEFKVSAGANSGIIYLLTAAHDPASGAPLGLEYQLLDDERHPDAKNGIDGDRTLASLYDIYPRAKLMTNVGVAPKIDVWQHARIVARADGTVEHWLNGIKVLEFKRGSDDYRAHVATSKFKATPGFGEAPRGHILLQDHGDAVAFRSIKIRPL